MSTLSSQTRKARLAKRLTQQELADKSGLSIMTINRIENGGVRTKITTIRKLELVLDIKFDFNEEEVGWAGRTLTLNDGKYQSLKKKIVVLGDGEVLVFPGGAHLAQKIRESLRRGRPINDNLPPVSVTCIKGKQIRIFHRAVHPWDGPDAKIENIATKELTP